jgi:hypothetical protein
MDLQYLIVLFLLVFHTISQQVIFDQPYNRQELVLDSYNPRLLSWKDWRQVILPMVGKAPISGTPEKLVPSISMGTITDPVDPTANGRPRRSASDALLDQVHLLPSMNSRNALEGKHEQQKRLIGLLKQKRDSFPTTNNALRALNSGMSAVDVQRNVDFLLPNQEPMSPEDLATICSGSLGFQIDESDDAASAASAAERQVAASQAAATRQATADSTQRKMALDTEEADAEGLQLFRQAFAAWTKERAITGAGAGAGKAKGSTGGGVTTAGGAGAGAGASLNK